MPRRIVSWGVLLFSFAILLLSNTPKDGWGYYFDWTFHVPIITLPILEYQVLAAIAGVISLFLIISGFWSKWSNRVEEFILRRLDFLLFMVYWVLYIIGFLKGIGSLAANSQPIWLVDLAFYVGFILFLIIPAHYFKWLYERRQHLTLTASNRV